jgi:DNA-directed RNA polymerase subunit RPC12/RpoP
VSVQVACISCQAPFDAVAYAGLVRCTDCDERLAFRLPDMGVGATVTVIDTPGEAWA